MTDDARLAGAFEKLRLIVGLGNVSTDDADCDLATADIFEWPDRKRAAAVVRPKDTPEVSGVLKVLHATDIAAVPRGAGLSYTGGMAVERTAVVVDLCRLTDMTIHRDDCYATIGAGASWQSVAERAMSHDLRSLQARRRVHQVAVHAELVAAVRHRRARGEEGRQLGAVVAPARAGRRSC